MKALDSEDEEYIMCLRYDSNLKMLFLRNAFALLKYLVPTRLVKAHDGEDADLPAIALPKRALAASFNGIFI